MAIPLRTARRIARLTQPELAAKSGVSQTTISAIERGANKKPTWDSVVRIAKALGVEPSEIFEEPAMPVVDEATEEATR
jgi:transcriptional regulator with XRE-family HTH domain